MQSLCFSRLAKGSPPSVWLARQLHTLFEQINFHSELPNFAFEFRDLAFILAVCDASAGSSFDSSSSYLRIHSLTKLRDRLLRRATSRRPGLPLK
jgi:hypothetical protein